MTEYYRLAITTEPGTGRLGHQGLYQFIGRRWGDLDIVVVAADRCWKCDRPNPDLAHAIFEYIAAMAGTVLRGRLDDAIIEHNATAHPRQWSFARTGDCPECELLHSLYPDAMIPIGYA